jgi:hypothetical protein
LTQRNGWLDNVGRRLTSSTKYPKTFDFKPIDTYFKFEKYGTAGICDEHQNCIKCAHSPGNVEGVFNARLKQPIDIQSSMPGSEHELYYVFYKGQYDIAWGSYISINLGHIKVDNDITTEIWKASGGQLSFGAGKFIDNQFGTPDNPLHMDLSTFSKINLELHNEILVAVGYFAQHWALPSLTILYVPSIPPEPSTVIIHVTNRSSGGAVKSAYVQLLAGSTVIVDGYTDSSGNIVFNDVPGGVGGSISYTLDITAGNFRELNESITITAGENSFSFALSPIPTTPLPWWFWYAVAGISIPTALGAGYVISKGRQQLQPIIVTR